jgi:hypothetical protein
MMAVDRNLRLTAVGGRTVYLSIVQDPKDIHQGKLTIRVGTHQRTVHCILEPQGRDLEVQLHEAVFQQLLVVADQEGIY